MVKVFRLTLAGGVLFLAPFAVLALILEKVFGLAHKLVAPIAASMPAESVMGVNLQMALAIILIVGCCFVAGRFARTVLAQKLVRAMETAMLSQVPGYEFIKSIGESILGVGRPDAHQVVFVRFDDSWQIGFLLEVLDNGLRSVFVPSAPHPYSGSVYFLTQERVTALNLAAHPTLRCLKRLGAGANELLGNLTLEQLGAQSQPSRHSISSTAMRSNQIHNHDKS